MSDIELRKSLLIAEELLPSSTYEEITTELARLEALVSSVAKSDATMIAGLAEERDRLKQVNQEMIDEQEAAFRKSLTAGHYADSTLLAVIRSTPTPRASGPHDELPDRQELASTLLCYQDRFRWQKAKIAAQIYSTNELTIEKACELAESILIECGL